jgi:hypothetical protein
VTLDAKRLERDWAADLRGRHFEEDEALRKANKAAAAAGGVGGARGSNEAGAKNHNCAASA